MSEWLNKIGRWIRNTLLKLLRKEKIICVDLTNLYGAGNEPSAEAIDLMLNMSKGKNIKTNGRVYYKILGRKSK